MKKAFWKFGLVLALAASAAGSVAALETRANQIRREVLYYLEKDNCAGAVKRLNVGLEEGLAPVELLAATMLDHGICLKPNWDKAEALYRKANKGGERAAPYRLAAGFAAPNRGPDVAAALWWLTRALEGDDIKGCEIPLEARDDTDRFVAHLQTWPEDKLLRCNYAAGLAATLAGEVYFPSRALASAEGGDYMVRFTPGMGRIEVKSSKAKQFLLIGVFNGDERERKSRFVDPFVDHLDQVSRRALKRYPQPAEIDPEWQFDIMFQFKID